MKSSTFFQRLLCALALTALLVACGGGGGSAGTASGVATSTPTGTSTASTTTGGATTTTASNGSVTLTLVDAAGAVISSRTLSRTQQQYLKVLVKDTKGVVAPTSKVKLSTDTTLATLTPAGGLLTDSAGVALFQIAPASVTSAGVATVVVTATINAVDVAQNIDFQIDRGSIGLSALTMNPASLQRGQALNVGVSVTLNGVAATSNSVSVDFATTCGTVTPSSALVDSGGKASTVIQTTLQGDCTVTASSGGVSTTGKYTVTAPPISGIQFVSASPTIIYQSNSTGVNTSIVKFKVIDSIGGAVPGVAVSASLSNLDGGINFCNSPNSATSGTDGTVSFSVCAGTLPGNVQVKAALTDTPAVVTSSNILTIQTGLPTQRFFSLSASQLNFDAWNIDGNKIDINIYAADRQGNPVPAGTPITFVSEGGQLNFSGASGCVIDKAGGCKVQLIGQNYRPLGANTVGEPRAGRVTVLAFADGEEYFIDADNNNRYTAGELFEDLGVPYLEKNENTSFNASYTNYLTSTVTTNDGEVTYPIPASAIGTSACPATSAYTLRSGSGVAGTCNGAWDALTKVRADIVIVFSGDAVAAPGAYDPHVPAAKRTQVISASTGQIVVQLADINGNPLPSDAPISVEVKQSAAAPDGQCSAKSNAAVIGTATEPTIHIAELTKCFGGELVQFKVTVRGLTTGIGVLVP